VAATEIHALPHRNKVDAQVTRLRQSIDAPQARSALSASRTQYEVPIGIASSLKS
jgi:hypothetical protein